ncbi:integrase arm-type DNA-binding domain-containing protein [Aminobacter sp. SR38]|uniref:integrase arm-type DNA-binding domain-containing protein n=1 Tax=Aminobacter sp. SR38 TaxID=2774562 RepID=UPI001785F158|nr:integrase arm-type DNA-binding domain-containing protein [Aminobacter sp. SR38]QOF73356.1 integrase arm-type DNA-binding domain-containing protein [Aminobacter sp. SR38]
MRISLNDRTIQRLPSPEKGRYIVRDTEQKGFFLMVGVRKKTFMIQGDLREHGKRASTIRVAIGDTGQFSTRAARAVAKGYLIQISRGIHPTSEEKATKASIVADLTNEQKDALVGVTVKEAWARYRIAMERRNRSARTIESYRDHVERIFKDWLDTPLKQLGDDPGQVSAKHDAISEKHGPYIANGSMRTFRAIYNHARKTNRELPADNPVDSVDWNHEKRRDTGMGMADLKAWFVEAAKLDNPIRREFHLFTLLSASRPTALKEARLEHLDLRRRVLHIPRPKGGADRAFDIPLSRQMINCLMRSIRCGRQMHPYEANYWLFPADGADGHLVEHKEDRAALSKWGNELRQTYRTVATPAGVSELDARMLMNHSVPGVNSGYITRHKLLEDHLRGQQQAISNTIFSTLGNALTAQPELRDWLGLGAARRQIARAREAFEQREVKTPRIGKTALARPTISSA